MSSATERQGFHSLQSRGQVNAVRSQVDAPSLTTNLAQEQDYQSLASMEGISKSRFELLEQFYPFNASSLQWKWLRSNFGGARQGVEVLWVLLTPSSCVLHWQKYQICNFWEQKRKKSELSNKCR